MDEPVPRPVTLRFEGRPLRCRADTTVAVALWEAGVRVLSHSPKYGRPRGLHCARGHCTSCLMRIDGVPNVRACQTPVRDGLRVERQDTGAFYGKPLQRVLASGAGLFPVGFYYKWFTRPAALSRLFLRGVRPLTGVGRLPEPAAWRGAPAAIDTADQGRDAWPAAAPLGGAERDLGLFDAVIVGAGHAGLCAAARASGRTLLVDDQTQPGGQRQPALAAVAEALGPRLAELPVLARHAESLRTAAAALPARPDLQRAFGCRVAGAYAPDLLLIRDARGLAIARARTVHWTAGALDALGLFEGNDLPGLFGPRGLYRVVARDGLNVKGQRALVAGGGLDLWLAAALLHVRGARVTVALGETGWADEVRTAVSWGWQVHTGLRVTQARARGGAVAAVRLDAPDGGESQVWIDCDLTVIAGRGKPAYDVPYQLGADLALNTARGGYLPRGLDDDRFENTLPGGVTLVVAGEAAGARPAAGHGPREE